MVLRVDIVTTSEVSISLSLDETGALDAITEDLKQIAAVRVETDRAIVCIVGEGLRSTPGIAGRVSRMLRWRTDKSIDDADTLDMLKGFLNEAMA